MNSPTWRDLAEHFHDITLARATMYARNRRVVALELQDVGRGGRRITASVQGSQSAPYRVKVDLSPDGPNAVAIESRCTCPVGYNCKHAAAALIARFGVTPAVAAARHVAGRSVVPSAPSRQARSFPNLPDAAFAQHETWLQRVRALGKPPQPAAPAQIRMVYAIGIDRYRLRPTVEPMYGHVRRDGSLSALKNANSDLRSLIEHRPQYVSDADVPLLRRLALASETLGHGPRQLTGDPDLLEALLNSGAAMTVDAAGHWGRALRRGEPRAGRAAWAVAGDGSQRFSLELTPPAPVMLLERLWYLDSGDGTIGPVNADIDVALAEVLLSAPAIEPTHVKRVAEALAAALVALPATAPRPPLPTEVARRTLQAKGVVHVHLANDEAVAYLRRAYTPERGAAALVHVVYDDLAVSLDDAGAARLHHGAMVAPRIDAKLHGKAHQWLLEADFEPMPARDGQAPHQRAFFIQEDRIPDLMLVEMPRWIEAGWVVTFEADFAWKLASVDAFYLDTDVQTDNAWFSLELGLDVDGRRVPLLPLIERLLAQRGASDALLDDAFDKDNPGGRLDHESAGVVVRIDEQHLVVLPRDRLRAILRTLIELHQPSGAKGSAPALRLARTDAARLTALTDAGFEWRGDGQLRRLSEKLSRFSAIEEVEPPVGLVAKLRPYQRCGLAWLQFLREYDLAGILADDMGLGKTVQTIAHLLVEKEAGRLTSPALVVAPTSVVPNWVAECDRFAPSLRTLLLHGQGRHASFADIAAHDVVLTTYPLLPRDVDELIKHQFHVVVFDEAQNLKNAKTQAAEAAGRLRATHRLALTGTPLENNLGELWSQFNVLMPGLLGDSRRFTQLYRTPIEKRGDSARRAHLARRVKPFILRRTKDMVARELPPKTEIEHHVELAGGQRDLYETVRVTMEKRVREALARQGLARSHIIVLDALLKLRQVCCDPRLVPGAAAKSIKQSAKLERLAELLPEMIAEGRRVLLFSQFTSVLALIEALLAELKIEYVMLTGDTKDRKTPVVKFQRGDVPLFLISLKAGGTGLNLTAADTVIHYDPWWNPAVENQATDRAHRIGQDKPVFVHRLIATGTVEERIRAMQSRKAELARAILDEDAALAKALTAQDMQALFEPLAG